MKRIFGANSNNNQPSASQTPLITAEAQETGSSGMTNDHGVSVEKATLVARPSFGTASAGTPRTPLGSTSTMGKYEYFPPTFPLSPASSVRQAPSSAYGAGGFPSPSIRSNSGAGLLAPVQNIAPPLSRQPTMAVQTGTTGALTDMTNSTTNVQAHSIDRNDLHKGVKSLEGLLLVLDEYRDLKCRLAKCEKKLTKGLEEMTKSKAFEQIPSKTFQAASNIYESKAEVSSKQAKMIQKEYEALNEHCAKYFKRVAKEERSFDEQLDTLDSKIKKAHASHDKGAKRNSKAALDSHDKFIQSMQALTNEVSRLKSTHGSSVGTKTFVTSLMVAATVGGLADADFKTLCESVRRSGQHIGGLHEWLNFTVNDAMANCQPPDLGEEGSGLGQRIVAKEDEIREELRRQEQIRLKKLEEEHAMLKLQQMGWTPPALHRQATMLNVTDKAGTKTESADLLPRLDSKGNLVEIPPKALSSSPGKEEGKSKGAIHHRSASSSVEGTVIVKNVEGDRGSAKGAEAITEEPEEEERASSGTPTMTADSSGASNSGLSASAHSGTNEGNTKGSEDSTQPVSDARSSGPLTPIEERADSVIIKHAEASPFESASQELVSSVETKRAVLKAPSVIPLYHNSLQKTSQVMQPQRYPSVWERNAEKDRQSELEQRLREAEDRLRMMERSGDNDHFIDRRQTPENTVQPSLRPRQSEQAPAHTHYEPPNEVDEMMPRNAGAQGGGVTRSLSTDSERSFVARMRAIYQADKAETQQREMYSERRSGTGTATSRRVSDQGYASYGRNDERSSVNAEHQHTRIRHDSAPSHPPSASRPKLLSAEPPHAKSCGCWNCSARHYRSADPPPSNRPTTGASISMAQTKAGILPPNPPPRHPSAITLTGREQALLAQHRRQTVQVLPEEHMYALAGRSGGKEALAAPAHQLYGRRSFEEEPQRRAMLSEKNYGTVR